MPVRVSIDKNAVIMRIQAASEKAVTELSKQVLADCNEFCPEDHGMLINSSEIHSNFKKGLLVWSTPYARYLYYGVLMVDPVTHSPYAKKGTRKILTNTELQYHGGKTIFFALPKNGGISAEITDGEGKSRSLNLQHGSTDLTVLFLCKDKTQTAAFDTLCEIGNFLDRLGEVKGETVQITGTGVRSGAGLVGKEGDFYIYSMIAQIGIYF